MFISKFGSINKEDIFDFNPNLPEEYVTFLEKYNGGETPETSFSVEKESSDIVAFYGIGDVKYSLATVKIITYEGMDFLPIAFDSFGNQIVISMDSGKIGFLNHENRKIEIIAENLKAFFDITKSEKVSDKYTKSISERENDLKARGRESIITDELRKLWQEEIYKYSQIHQEEVIL